MICNRYILIFQAAPRLSASVSTAIPGHGFHIGHFSLIFRASGEVYCRSGFLYYTCSASHCLALVHYAWRHFQPTCRFITSAFASDYNGLCEALSSNNTRILRRIDDIGGARRWAERHFYDAKSNTFFRPMHCGFISGDKPEGYYCFSAISRRADDARDAPVS